MLESNTYSSSCHASEKSIGHLSHGSLTRKTSSTSCLPRALLRCIPPYGPLRERRRNKPTRDFQPPKLSEENTIGTASYPDVSLPKMQSTIEARPYHWPIGDAIFDIDTTALIIIDMQNDCGYIEAQGYDITDTRAIIPNIQKILGAFRARGMTVYHTREGHRPDLSTLSQREYLRSKRNESGLGIGDHGPMGRLLIRGEKGHDIIPELYPVVGENVVDKPGRSAFQHTELGLMLSNKVIKNLILCGVTTDVCVHSTMREANDNGFDCLLVEDATAASERLLHEGAVASVEAEGGIFGAVTTTGKVLSAMNVSHKGHLAAGIGNAI